MGQSEGAGLYLFNIPSERPAGVPVLQGSTVVADLAVRDPDMVAESLSLNAGVRVIGVEDEWVRIELTSGSTLPGDPQPSDTEASFVVDFDEPIVQSVVSDLRERYGEKPSLPALAEHAGAHIALKNYRNGFDLASQVASSGEGDCTEHAVLLTALARATGRPARLVFGLLMVGASSGAYSFGHAWTEIYSDRRWQIADATDPGAGLKDARLYYLPLFSMANEGPGYAMELMKFSMLQPSRVAFGHSG